MGEEQAGAGGGSGEASAMGQQSCHDHELCPLTSCKGYLWTSSMPQ